MTNMEEFTGIMKKCISFLKKWSNDASVVTGAKSNYVIALLTVNKSISPKSYFPIQKFAKVIYDFMEN